MDTEICGFRGLKSKGTSTTSAFVTCDAKVLFARTCDARVLF